MGRLLACALVAAVAFAGCSDDDDSDPTTTGCEATPIIIGTQGAEIAGVGDGATAYGLVFLPHPVPIRAGDDIKIVWRMTGEGDLMVESTSPTGQPGVLTFGPEAHDSSTYTRPGDEWGTGFLFDEPGCWHIHLQRTEGAADAWIDVAAVE